jgi:uncharacterized protein with LGFP repeats
VVWSAQGAFNGPLGLPTNDAGTGNYVQTFQGGSITVVNGVGSITGTTDALSATVAANPWLGPAKSNRICGLPGNGCYQIFASGNVYWSPATGAHTLRPEVGVVWSAQGAFNGPLGLPTNDAGTGNYVQTFQRGAITVTNGVGALTPSVDAFSAAIEANPWLGASISGKICGLPSDGCYQIFTSGNLYWSPSTGAHTLRSEVGVAWSARGAYSGSLGLPTSDAGANGNYVQTFQGGMIIVVNGTATVS